MDLEIHWAFIGPTFHLSRFMNIVTHFANGNLYIYVTDKHSGLLNGKCVLPLILEEICSLNVLSRIKMFLHDCVTTSSWELS